MNFLQKVTARLRRSLISRLKDWQGDQFLLIFFDAEIHSFLKLRGSIISISSQRTASFLLEDSFLIEKSRLLLIASGF